MTEKPPRLTVVDSTSRLDVEAEFIPLPYFPWPVRPAHLPLEVEEVATALYLGEGIISRAAERLKCEPLKVVRSIARSARLQRLHGELAALLNDKVHEEYVRAFADEDSRRREWAASKVANTKQFQSHPLAPNSNLAPQLGSNPAGPMRIVISWEDAATEPLTIEPESGD